MTTVLRQDATMDGALVGSGDTAVHAAAGAAHDRPGRDQVPGRESRVGPGPLDVGRAARLPGPGAGRWGWQQLAACQGMDSSRFFGPERERATAGAARIAAAKGVCAGCSVLLECRVFAVHSGEPYGSGVGSPSTNARKSWNHIPLVPTTSSGWISPLSLIHISEPTRRTPISYAVF